MLAIGPSMANILEFYGRRRAYGLSVSTNPLRRNPIYQAVTNPDLSLRRGDIQYIVWDAFSARRSAHFERRLLSYVSRYHGRAVYTYSTLSPRARRRPRARPGDHRLRGAPHETLCDRAAPRWPRRSQRAASVAARTAPTTPIRHIVVLMQENHSFDNYFGTYPGADGLPAGACLPKSFENSALGCSSPSHVGGHAVLGLGSDPALFSAQLHGGQMDGFVAAYRVGRGLGGLPNPLGYYDARDLPYAWNLAGRYVLFDHFFSSARGGSVWNHMFAISATPGNRAADHLPPGGFPDTTDDLRQARRSPASHGGTTSTTTTPRTPSTTRAAARARRSSCRSRCSRCPRFVQSPRLVSNIVDMKQFFRDAQAGRLPAVSYIAPGAVSEHPPGKLVAGQTFVRSVVNELMRSPDWKQHRVRATYDSWGGWYDHVRPPMVDRYGYGFRVPTLLVSPYAKRGAIDHADARLHLDPALHRGQLAARAAREPRRGARSIASAFDFSAPPRAPAFVSTQPLPPAATARTRVSSTGPMAAPSCSRSSDRRRPWRRGGACAPALEVAP